jgi:hypothetical protein
MKRLLPLLLLAGCAVDDPYLQVAPELPPTVATPSVPRPVRPPVEPPPPTPWDVLNPGELPELKFVVAWSPWDCSGDIDGLHDPGVPGDSPTDAPDPNGDRELWGACPANYAVIDLFGQVLAEYALPDAWPEDEWLDSFTHLDLLPGGPGEFVVVADNWLNDFPAEPDEDSDSAAGDSDGFWQNLRWQVWSIDPYADAMERIAAWEPGTSLVHMMQSEQRVNLGGPQGWMHVAVAPDDPDWLLFWSGEWSCDGPGMRRLVRVHRDDPLALGHALDPAQFLGEELTTTKDDLRPWTMAATLDEEGNAQYLFGVTDDHCAPYEDVEALVVGWSPDTGESWEASVDPWLWPESTSFAGWHGGGALSVLNLPHDGSWGWQLHGPAGVREGTLETDRFLHRVGPLLDPAAETFVTLSRNGDTWSDSLDVYHRGERVWSIDALQFGLQERTVILLDAIVLPPVPED